MIGYVFLSIAFVLNASANLLLKAGSGRLPSGISKAGAWELLTNYALLAGLALFAINIVVYAVALSKLPLSVAYPVMVAGSLLIVTLGSALYLRESLTFIQIMGMLLLLGAIVMVSSGS